MYRCTKCDGEEIPLAAGPIAPAAYFAIPESERAERCELTKDICLVDEQFYIVGNLELPIHGREDFFSWDIWVSLSLENAKRTQELWESDSRIKEPPYFGWFCSSLPGYPETIGLKTHVHTRAVGCRPAIELEPTDHPLALEQRDGIEWNRVKEIAKIMADQN